MNHMFAVVGASKDAPASTPAPPSAVPPRGSPLCAEPKTYDRFMDHVRDQRHGALVRQGYTIFRFFLANCIAATSHCKYSNEDNESD